MARPADAASSQATPSVVGGALGPKSCYIPRMSSRNAVLAEALQLSPEERADVAKRLIASLDDPADEDVEAAWLAEVERRLQDVDRGTASVEPWDAVRERLARRLRTNRK
jgi:putative addiction module component (TIGR02574 family)